MYPNMFNRDEIFFRLGVEKSDDLLEKLKTVDNPNFQNSGDRLRHTGLFSDY